MKFDAGNWKLLPDTEAKCALTVMDVRTEPDALVVVGYNKVVNHRADTLDGAVFTARFTSPLPDVARVQITHFKGRRPRLPVFDLDYALSNTAVEIGRDEAHAWLKTGDLSVVVPVEGNWRVEFLRGGRPLTSSEHKAQRGTVCNHSPAHNPTVCLPLGPKHPSQGGFFTPTPFPAPFTV